MGQHFLHGPSLGENIYVHYMKKKSFRYGSLYKQSNLLRECHDSGVWAWRKSVIQVTWLYIQDIHFNRSTIVTTYEDFTYFLVVVKKKKLKIFNYCTPFSNMEVNFIKFRHNILRLFVFLTLKPNRLRTTALRILQNWICLF